MNQGQNTPPAGNPGPRAFSGRDIALLFGLPMMGALAWFLPEPAWPGFCRRCAGFNWATLSTSEKAVAARARAMFGPEVDRLAMPPQAVARGVAAEDMIAGFQLMRAYRLGGWNPATVVEGATHIDNGLAEGRGVILWVAQFTQGPLGAKKALWDAGYRISHLSHPRHGFSATRFGMRYLNAVRRRAEDRYIAERVMLSLDGAAGALEHLTRRLAENRIVSFTAGPVARRAHRVSVGGATVTLAGGAADLAYRTGATLLPIFPVHENGVIRVAVEGPLHLDRDAPRRDVVAAAAREFGARLEAWLATHPDQWLGWFRSE